MPSGKQVLLYFLKKYSLKKTKKKNLQEVSENLRVAFLLHGSTPKEMWQNVDTIEWGEEIDKDDDSIISQGLKIKDKNIPLTELFECMIWNSDKKIPKKVAKRFPNLTQSEFYSATRIMSLLLSSIEWSNWLSQVENGGKMDFKELEGYLKSYKEKLNYFREDPENYE